MARVVAGSYRAYRRVLVGGAGTTLFLLVLKLPFTVHIWKGWWDAYSGYSGVILKDDQGHTFKKYVGHYGYAFTRIGTFVVKKRGFAEYPRQSGEKTPTELLREEERIKAHKPAPR